MSGISFDNFKDWNKSCRVRKIQKSFDKIVQDAQASGKTVDEEMKAQGHKDYAAFSKQCPQFDLTCWPEEFAELGSGFVLYFQFIFFLAFILVLVMLLQVPALSAYAGEDYLTGWEWHNWNDGWSDNSDACNCLGSNGGFLGSPEIADYGTSCRAWDMDWCSKQPAGTLPYEALGKWCCTQWCFVSEKCQSKETSPAYMQNVHVKGMVRATSSCAQKDVFDKCLPLDNLDDTPYKSLGYEAPKHSFIGKSWVSPGNYGPDQADNGLIPFMFLVTVVVLGFFTVVLYQHQIYTDAKVDAGTTSPNDFAILVKGLPTTAVDEGDLKKFFQENAVKGREVEVVKVVIGWDVEEYRVKMAEIRSLMGKLKELETDDPAYLETRKQIAQVKSDLASSAPDRAARLRSSGIVVVVFRYQQDLRACLDRWTGFWANWFYSDSEDTCCLPGANGFWKGAGLPKYPFGNPPVPVNVLKILRAANPGDIHWEELGKDPAEVRSLFMKTNAIMSVLLLFSFGFTYGLNSAQSYVAEEEEKKKAGGGSAMHFRLLSLLPGFGLAIVNMILMVSARKLGDKEYHETWTSQEFSQGAKMAASLLINTAGVLLFSNLQPREWYEAGGLIDDAFFILLSDAIIPPLIFYFDMKYAIVGCTRRRKLTQKRIDSWNETLGSNRGQTKENLAAKNGVAAEVEGFKKMFEPSEMDYPRRYANALNTFFCTLFFSPVCPFTPLIGVGGLLLQYYIDKYLLLRWYKRPKRPYNAMMAQWSLRVVKTFGPLGLSLAFFFFLSPSWDDKGQVFQPFLLSLIVCAVLMFVPTAILRTLLGLRCLLSANAFQESSDGGNDDYYQAQYIWSKEMKYHKDHFLYKSLSEKVNPEFLVAGTDSGLKLDDIKGGYGAATGAAAETTGMDAPVALKGGRVMGAGAWGAGAADASAAAPAAASYGAVAPAPVAYGVAAAPAPAPAEARCEHGVLDSVYCAACEAPDKPATAEGVCEHGVSDSAYCAACEEVEVLSP